MTPGESDEGNTSTSGERLFRPPSDELRACITKLRREGKTVGAIARILLLTRAVVRAVLDYRL